jgi:hypothetical protein
MIKTVWKTIEENQQKKKERKKDFHQWKIM